MRSTILVIRPTTQQQLAAILTRESYHLESASATDLPGLAVSGQFDLVILDHAGLGADCGNLLAQLQQAAEADNQVRVLITSVPRADTDLLLRLIPMNADFLPPEYSEAELLLRVHNLVSDARRERIEKARRQLIERDREKLQRYFSPEIIDDVLAERPAGSNLGRLATASIMLFDLRASTTIGESLAPEAFFQFLQEFFFDLSDLVFSNGGSISKYTGDGFLATFGLNGFSEASVHNAVECALKIREHMDFINSVQGGPNGQKLGYGIGIATGSVYAGSIGTVHRLEYTVFGDVVNLASRLEALTKRAGADIFIDGETRHLLGQHLHVKRVKHSGIRGKERSVEIFYPVRLLP